MTSLAGVVVDTSAAVAILTNEPGAGVLRDALSRAERAVMPAATYLELAMVVESRLGVAGVGRAARFVRDAEIDVVALHAGAAERALEGWRRFGEGRHPASLNFGDCMVYGVALEHDLPVLCTGDDFTRTDVPVITPAGA